jgi:transmembrane sensor
MRKTNCQTVLGLKEAIMLVEGRRDEAIGWHIRLSNPAAPAAEWEAFTDWLEAHPANADAYDAVALADAELADSLRISRVDPSVPQNDNEPAPARWYQRRGLMAVAASAALALLASPFLLPGRDMQSYETKPGETREIALSDGSQIAMNGGTKLELDRKSNRFARLETGEAVFIIRHDAANPFTLETPDSTLRDLGTIFDVRQDDDGLDVSVAEGSVQYSHRAEAVTVGSGNRLQVSRDRPAPVLSKADPASVAGWRQGRLSYQAAPLSTIAVDLTRSLGTSVSISADISGRRFTGVIQIDRDQKRFFRRLESLLGVRARHTAKGWQLTS